MHQFPIDYETGIIAVATWEPIVCLYSRDRSIVAVKHWWSLIAVATTQVHLLALVMAYAGGCWSLIAVATSQP